MKRVISALLAAFIIVITTVITTPAVALETQTPVDSNIFVFGVHPDTPLVEHMPLYNALSFELDFRNDDIVSLNFTNGAIRYFDSQGNQMGSELTFLTVEFEAAVGLRTGGAGGAASGEIQAGQRLILFFPREILGHNVVPASIDVDLFFDEYPLDPLSFIDIEIAEYHVPPGQTYIYPVGFLGVPGDRIWFSGGAHELRTGHRGTLRPAPTIGPFTTDIWVNQRYAYDIDLRDLANTGSRCNPADDCTLNSNIFAWGQPVLAMAEGEVILILKDNADNVNVYTPPPSLNACGATACDNQPDAGLCAPSDPFFTCPTVSCPDGSTVPGFPGSGNSVVLLHPNGEYSTHAHMVNGSNSHLNCGDPVERGDILGGVGMSGNGSITHHHFTTITAPGPEAFLAENYPIYFNNVSFKTPLQSKTRLQLDTSLPSRTLIDVIGPAPIPTFPNPPDGPGDVMETANPNNFLFDHQSLLLPVSVEGVAETGDGAEVAVRGDGMEDVYRTDLAAPSTLQVDLFGPGHIQNLDVYVMNDDYRVLNPTRQGTSPTASETICLALEEGAYYMMVSNVNQDPAEDADYILQVADGLAPVLTVPGDLDLGNACPGATVSATLNVCNTGGDTDSCHLEVDEILSSDPQFAVTEPSSGFPVSISSDFCFPFQVSFTPEEGVFGPQETVLTIPSNDPLNPEVAVVVTANSGQPDLIIDPAALEGLNAFPATVVDSSGSLGCFSERTVTLRNNSVCPLTIEDIAARGDADTADYAVISPTVFPILLPGGEETLEVTLRFTPQEDLFPLAPTQITGVMTVTSDDTVSDNTAALCGEGVTLSGLRVLVTDVSSGTPIPVDEIDSLTIQSKGKNRPGPINLQFVDHPLSNATVCSNDIFWHVDQETLPSTETSGSGRKSSYQTKAMEGNLQATESFGLGQCEFRDFQLELQDSTSDICLGLPKGADCSNAGECCSGKCKGPSGAKTCK